MPDFPVTEPSRLVASGFNLRPVPVRSGTGWKHENHGFSQLHQVQPTSPTSLKWVHSANHGFSQLHPFQHANGGDMQTYPVTSWPGLVDDVAWMLLDRTPPLRPALWATCLWTSSLWAAGLWAASLWTTSLWAACVWTRPAVS